MGNPPYSTREEAPDMISVLEDLTTGIITAEGITENEEKPNTLLGEIPKRIQPLFRSLAKVIDLDTKDGEDVRYTRGNDVAYMNIHVGGSETPVRQAFYNKEPKED